jgi:hypothetical protein
MSRKELIEDDASQYDSINARLRRLESHAPEDPHYVGTTGEPAFQNSWTNFDAAAPPAGRAAYFYRHNGRVHMGGVIMGGANGATAFTLPAGYRSLLSSATLVVNASGAAAYITVGSDGSVTPFNLTGSSVTTYCFLEGASFRHA